jgi:hypothetical protein
MNPCNLEPYVRGTILYTVKSKEPGLGVLIYQPITANLFCILHDITYYKTLTMRMDTHYLFSTVVVLA